MNQDGSVTIDISFDPALALLMEDFARVDFSDMKEPLTKVITDVMVPSIQQNFVSGGRPKWQPLSEATTWIRNPSSQASPELIAPGSRRGPRGKAFGDNVPLVRTGELMAIATSVELWDITESEAVSSNLGDADYGLFHMTGTRFMPARPFLVMQDTDEDKAVEIFEDWAVNKLGDWGF